MIAGTVVEALSSGVAAVAADVVDIAKVSAAAKDDSSEQQQPERIALTCGAVVAVVVVDAAAAAVVADAKTADHYAGAPVSPVPYFSMFEVVAVPTSPEQDSLTATAAGAQTDHCLPATPTSPAQHHPSLLEWTENAAAAAAEHSKEQRTVALMADYVVGNSEVQVAANAVDLATSDYQKHLKTVDPDLDQMNQGSSNLIATDCQNSFHCQHQIVDPLPP